MSFEETQRRHRRLSILIVLKDAPGYRCNDSILRDSLSPFGFDPTRDQLRGDLAWLAEQGFIELTAAGKLSVAKILASGVDIAEGRGRHPDIQRPSA